MNDFPGFITLHGLGRPSGSQRASLIQDHTRPLYIHAAVEW